MYLMMILHTEVNNYSNYYVYKCKFTIVYLCVYKIESMHTALVKNLYLESKEASLFGRYIHSLHIQPLLENLSRKFQVDAMGQSVNGLDIYSVTVGTGPKRILMWSQMHGNESTTTKALFDLLNFLSTNRPQAHDLLSACTLKIIPILNPDGAKAYIRVNAKGVDLNRDAQDLSQPESKLLRQVFIDFQPDFCYNLHGQRTIFSAGKSKNSATVSFLSPSQDENCTLTENRKVSMEVIAAMNSHLQEIIPNQVGIYDDAFNINCVGDTFQSFGIPTILFEAGHFHEDYEREITRELIFQAYLVSLHYIVNNNPDGSRYRPYLQIPMNEKLFFDFIIRNATVNNEIVDIAFQFQEILQDGDINFSSRIEKIGDLSNFYGHREINVNKHPILTHDMVPVFEGYENDFVMQKNERILVNVTKN